MWNPFFKKTKNFVTIAKSKLAHLQKQAEHKEEKTEKIVKPPKGAKRDLVDISVSSVSKATLAVIGLGLLAYALFEVRSILLTFFISIFLGAALDPFISKMESKKVPRWLGIIIVYLIIIALIGLLISLIIPILLTQIPKIAEATILALAGLFPGINIDAEFINQTARTLQDYLSQINVREISGTGVQSILDSASVIVNETWQNALSIIASVSGGIINFVVVLVITFFLLLDKNSLAQFFTSLFPDSYKAYIGSKATAIQKKIGEWLAGQLMLSLAIGITTFIILMILGVDYALTLAIIAAITEFIPYIGPIIAGIPAILVALGQGGVFFAIWVVAAIIVIQQIENNFLVPIIMKKSVGLSPVATIFAMMIGFQVLGILGMILAVPIATSIGIFISDYSHRDGK